MAKDKIEFCILLLVCWKYKYSNTINMKELNQAERNSNYQITKLFFPFKALDQAKCKSSPED